MGSNLKSLKANVGRSPRRANARNVSFKLSTVASWVDNTKLPWNTLPPTQHHSFYRNYPFIQMIYYIPLVSWNLIGQLCVTRQRKVFRIVVQYNSTYMTCLLVVCCVRGHVMHLLFSLQNFALWTEGNLTKMLSRALKEHQANQAVQREKQGILIFTQSNRNFFGFVVREQLFCNWVAGPCIRSDVH